MGDSSALHLLPEEADQLRRSVKKHKRDEDLSDQEMGEQPAAEGPTPPPWQTGTFAEMLQKAPTKPPLYTGEGEDDLIDELGMVDILQDQDTVEEGELCPMVDIPWDHYKQTWQKWRRALIVRTLGKSFSFKVLEPRIRWLWKLQYDCELIDMDKGFMVARFFSKQDYMKVLTGGPWLILGHYLTLTKWRPNFQPSAMEVQTTLEWVRFPTLPLENFDDQSLLRIGNAVGKAIRVDSHSVDASKGRYARVCVELNLTAPLVPNVLVWGRKQPVEYEGLPRICFKCGRHGHKMESCDRQHPGDDDGGQPIRQETSTEQRSTVENPFGP